MIEQLQLLKAIVAILINIDREIDALIGGNERSNDFEGMLCLSEGIAKINKSIDLLGG